MKRTLPAIVAALAARAALAAPPAAALPPALSGEVQVTADDVRYEPATGRVRLQGNAVVRRGAIFLRARTAEWDPATGEVRASGDVLLTDPTRVVSAAAVRAVMGGDFEAEGVLAFVKDQPVDLSGIRSADEAGRTGRNRLTFSTPRLRGSEQGRHLLLEGARLTLCDCQGGAPPSWEITARRADVVPGDRAILTWPVLRIAPPFASRTVPVLVFPWLYLPLGDRQSGLLIPTVGSTGQSGFSIAQPIYLTLGRSADATLTPEYAFGRGTADVRAGLPAVRGPGARLELRWAPAEGAEGKLELGWVNDLDAEQGGAHGERAALVLTHGQRFGDATSLHAALRLAGDPVWVRDMTPDLLAQSIPYQRSDVLVSHRGDSLVTEAVASYDQPLEPVPSGVAAPWDALPTTPKQWGTLGADRGVSSRFGSAATTLVPVPAGPLLLSGRIGAARFGPVHGVGPGDVDVVGRTATTRADARAEVAVPLLLGGAATLSPFVRGAALGYAADGETADTASWGVAGATLETEVSRRFGELRHVIAPRLEWRAGTQAAGRTLHVPAFDLYDRSTVGLLSATPGEFQQLRASVETRLETANATVLRAEIGQDFDVRARRYAEAFASLSLAVGPLGADGSARFLSIDRREVPAPTPLIRSSLDALTELSASLSLKDARGDSLRAGFLSVGPGGSGRLVAGLDPLFDVRATALEAAAVGTLGVKANVGGGARLAYDALLQGRDAFVPACDAGAAAGGALRRVSAFQVAQHSASLAWESPCHCFRITISARITDCGDYGYSAAIDLARLGSGGTAPGATAR